jgi:hypothetical protein
VLTVELKRRSPWLVEGTSSRRAQEFFDRLPEDIRLARISEECPPQCYPTSGPHGIANLLYAHLLLYPMEGRSSDGEVKHCRVKFGIFKSAGNDFQFRGRCHLCQKPGHRPIRLDSDHSGALGEQFASNETGAWTNFEDSASNAEPASLNESFVDGPGIVRPSRLVALGIDAEESSTFVSAENLA